MEIQNSGKLLHIHAQQNQANQSPEKVEKSKDRLKKMENRVWGACAECVGEGLRAEEGRVRYDKQGLPG